LANAPTGFRDKSSKQTGDLIEGYWRIPELLDRLITPSAHYLASSGNGSAQLQLGCLAILERLMKIDAMIYKSGVIPQVEASLAHRWVVNDEE
jgi:hypothetical protein